MNNGEVMRLSQPIEYEITPVRNDEVAAQNFALIEQLRANDAIWLNLMPDHGPEPVTDVELCGQQNREMLNSLYEKFNVDVSEYEIIKMADTVNDSDEHLLARSRTCVVRESPSGHIFIEYNSDIKGHSTSFGVLVALA